MTHAARARTAGHLLLAGSHLDRLLDLCVALRGYFATTTVAHTDDGPFRTADFDAAVLCLGGRESPEELENLLRACRPVLFIGNESASACLQRVRSAGGLVLDAADSCAVIQATLLAFATQRRPHNTVR